jgi:F-type H+-transporting ATPase subunit delta
VIVAKAYAKALYEAARETNTSREGMDLLGSQLDNVLTAILSSKAAQNALFGPVATTKEKAAVMASISEACKAPPLLSHFLQLLARRGRLSLLEEITEAFMEVRLSYENSLAGRLIAAESMNDSDVESLAAAFTKKLGKKVVFRVSTDPALLAGVKVTVNGVTYDGTLRAQLQKLRDQFVFGFNEGQA